MGIEIKNIETENVEFKREWRDEFLKVICAFANSCGGTLFIGKDDNGNNIGLENSKELLEVLPNKIFSKLGILPTIKFEDTTKIISINVQSSSIPISLNGRFYIRSGSVVIELQGKKLSDFLLKKSGSTWDEFTLDKAGLDYIDFDTIERFKTYSMDRLPSIISDKPIEILKKLNLTDGNHFKRAAILLFGNNTQKFFPQAHIRIGKFLTDSEIISSDLIEGNLFQQVEKSIEILKNKYLLSYFSFEGIHRREKTEYPIESLREAILNAIIHRNYNSTSSVQIRVYDNKLMILNEGGLPDELKIDDLRKVHLSIPRNRLLADSFYKAGFIESWGSGTLKIIDYCKDSKVNEVVFSDLNYTFSISYILNVPENVTDNVTENVTENVTDNVTDNRQKLILDIIKENNKITTSEIAKKLDVVRRTIARDIDELKNKGVIERIGPDKGGYWKVLDNE